jgi:hypothetical protein
VAGTAGRTGTFSSVDQSMCSAIRAGPTTGPRKIFRSLVFTLAQWKKIENDELFVSAAPIGPGELGRNRKYVFALPARFTYAEVDEKEEVEDLIRRNPLKAF